MKVPLLLSLLCIYAVSAWAGQPRGVVKVTFQSGKSAVASLDLKVEPVKAGSFSVMADRMVPTKWELPKKMSGADGSVYFSPATPGAFENRQVGLTITGTARQEKGLVILDCKITQSEWRQLQSVYGENVERMDAGNGQVVTFGKPGGESGTVTSTTNFSLFAQPGKTYEIPVLFGGKTVTWLVTCTVP